MMTAIGALIWKIRFAVAMWRSERIGLADAWLWAAVTLARYGLDKRPADAVASELNRW